MKFNKNNLIPKIWTFSVLFYLLRSIAEPLKYLFLVFFGLLVITYSIELIRNFKNNLIFKFLHSTIEFQILGLFILVGVLLSNHYELRSLKGLLNFLGISFFFLIYFEYKDHISVKKVLHRWMIFTVLIGIVGLLKWLNLILDLNLNWFSIFYSSGSSLVTEYNFYACYFLISLVIYYYGIRNKLVQTKLIYSLGILTILLLNVLFSQSRRGLILFILLLLLSVYYLIVLRKEKRELFYKTIFYLNTIFYGFILVLIVLVPFRSRIIHDETLQNNITFSVYRYATILKPNINFLVLSENLWPRSSYYENDDTNWTLYSTYNSLEEDSINNNLKKLKNDYWTDFTNRKSPDNILYNGNFEYGTKFWGKSAPDSIKHEIIHTKYGNAIRVSRNDGRGYWPLEYEGRRILYYAGVTYNFKFKYRIIKGNKNNPFMIGWWVKEGNSYKNNLPKSVKKLDNEWFECNASYEFVENHSDLTMFMNSQSTNSVIDFADIELTCEDELKRPVYLDQSDLIRGENLLYNSNFDHGLKFWGYTTLDSIDHKIVNTQFGKAIRVSRKNGSGYWPLSYLGRDIFYYKDLTYVFRFKFKVIKGNNIPFQIGWRFTDDGKILYNINKYTFPLGNGWMECIASYKFQEDHYDKVVTFLNSLHPYNIVDFADIELFCNDTLKRPMYVDEKIDMLRELEKSRIKEQLKQEHEKLFSARIERWKYTSELYISEYDLKNKLIGKGFDYLTQFGKKFYPDENRIDYPHNPIFSSFLYSGLLGGLFYLYVLLLSFWYYWKYRKYHMVFFLCYLIIFLFVFVSSDSHFDTPIFAFLSLIPFITRHVVTKELNKNINDMDLDKSTT